MNEPLAICTILTVAVTVVVSFLGFQDPRVTEKYLFSTRDVLGGRQYWRLFTSGLLHGNWTHLLFNMFSLYSFARYLEVFFGLTTFLLIYIGSILGGNLLALLLHRHHEYRALGASGGVCGIIFASIFLLPGGGVIIFPVPVAIPSWLYAILFIVVSYIGMRRGVGNIGHDAHLGGAIIGLLITTVLYPHIIRQRPLLYAAVIGLALALAVYTYKWPPHLPHASPFTREYWRQARNNRRKQAAFRRSVSDEQTLERLLSKISQSGLHSLSEAETRELNAIARRQKNRGR